jgi:hypothetical protein
MYYFSHFGSDFNSLQKDKKDFKIKKECEVWTDIWEVWTFFSVFVRIISQKKSVQNCHSEGVSPKIVTLQESRTMLKTFNSVTK